MNTELVKQAHKLSFEYEFKYSGRQITCHVNWHWVDDYELGSGWRNWVEIDKIYCFDQDGNQIPVSKALEDHICELIEEQEREAFMTLMGT